MNQRKLRTFILRLSLSIIGTIIIAIGIVFFRLADLGIDPVTAANIGISETFHLSLGNYQLAFNLVLFIIILFFDRSKFGIGTLINMSLPGYIIGHLTPILNDALSGLFQQVIITNIIYFATGMFLFSLGIGIYSATNLGVSPYDAIAPIIYEKRLASYRLTRSTQDLIFVSITWMFGGPLGIGTLVIATLTGYFVQYWQQLFKKIIIRAQ